MNEPRTQASSMKSFTRGGQIALNNFRMFNQVYAKLLVFCFLLTILFMVLLLWIFLSHDLWVGVSRFWMASFWHHIAPNQDVRLYLIPFKDQVFRVTGTEILSEPYFRVALHRFYEDALGAFLISSASSIAVLMLCVRWLRKKGESQTLDTFIRGAKLLPARQVADLLDKENNASDISIYEAKFPKNFELQHVCIHGTTGAGKGQTYLKILDAIVIRGERAIIYDKGGVFIQHYYRPGIDILLNPLDERCAFWSLWDEAISESDFLNMAESLIPMHGEVDPFWVNSARTIFQSIAWKMRLDADRSIEKLIKVLITIELDELKTYVAGTDAASLAADEIEKTAISIRSVLTTHVKSLRYLIGIEKGGKGEKEKFSLREWMHDEDNRYSGSFVFITSSGKQHAALKSLISMWISLGSIELLGMEEDRSRRIHFIIDELPSLNRLPLLPETIAESRKFGGCFYLGMQSFAQLQRTYGRDEAGAIFDLLNTRFFFRNPSSQQAEITSRELGEAEIEVMKENYSYGASTIRDGVSIGRQLERRPIVSYTEIMNLPNMSCYVRTLGGYPVMLLNLVLDVREAKSPAFVLRSLIIDSSIEARIESNEAFLRSQLNLEIADQVLVDERSEVELGSSSEKQILTPKRRKNPFQEKNIILDLQHEELQINTDPTKVQSSKSNKSKLI